MSDSKNMHADEVETDVALEWLPGTFFSSLLLALTAAEILVN